MKGWIDKTISISLMFLVGSILAISLSLSVKIFNILEQPMTIDLSNVKLETGIADEEMIDFLVVSKRFARTHKYENESYNCINYSRDFMQTANSLGFKTRMITGCENYNSSCHRFIRLEMDLEPQYGEFVDYSKKYPIQIEANE